MELPNLQIKLLGGVTFIHQGNVISSFVSRKVEALLLYLVCNPRPHPRETLAALLWPDSPQKRALANLSVALSNIRKQIPDFIIADRHTVACNTDGSYWLDVAAFDEALALLASEAPLGRSAAVGLQTAVDLYHGDFLAGFNLRNTPEFESWVLLEQENYRQKLLNALESLLQFHQNRGQVEAAIATGQKLLYFDPLQENIHRELMILFARSRQRAAALAQFASCRDCLQEELGVAPDEDTITVYEQIRAGAWDAEEDMDSSASAHNLPAAANAFIGRETELAQIREWLARPHSRLLTITGPGGMGKSRLAIEAARQFVGEFADGVWFVSLVPFADLDGMATAVAETLRLNLSGQKAIPEQLAAQLRTRELLLILDNLEHLLDAPLRDFLTDLVRSAPELRLIATSRERLRLRAERLLELRGLVSAPAPGVEMGAYPAVALFLNRVARVQGGVELGREETAVWELCRLVGGLPLALELAATWTRVLSVSEIVTEIQEGLDNLSSDLHDLPDRHRSLQAVVESSWEMLPVADRRLYRRLAVFRGGFTVDAAKAVAEARLPQLMSLIDRSFLRRDADHRFRRHPLLLQFARQKLAAEPADAEAITKAHALFFARQLAQLQDQLTGEDAQKKLQALAAEMENIRNAWQWALQHRQTTLLTQMVAALGRFFIDRARYLEGTGLFGRSVELIKTWPQTAENGVLLAQIQVELGFLLYQVGNFAEAETVLVRANQLAIAQDLPLTQLHCLQHLADVIGDQGRREEARKYLEMALQASEIVDDEGTAVRIKILNSLGNNETDSGNYDKARVYFTTAMEIAERTGNKLRVAILHNNMAIAANRQESYEEALEQYKLARAGFVDVNHQWGMAATQHNIGMIYAALEEYDRAFETIQEAYAAHEAIGHKRGMVGGLSMLGTIKAKVGLPAEARDYFYRSLELAQEVGVIWSALATLVDIAELERADGRLQLAAAYLYFVQHHTATEASTREKAQELWLELQSQLSNKQREQIMGSNQDLTIEKITTDLLNGG